MSEMGVAVDAQAARELGFGDVSGLLTRSFTAPLEWTAHQPLQGAPAEGYQSRTSVAIETRVAGLEHRIPGLDGCEDSLRVTLDVSFATSDGALSVGGRAVATMSRTPKSSASGRLDLSTARGSLRLFPDESVPSPRVGYLNVGLSFWPDMVRGDFYVELIGVGTEDSDVRASYRPLDGRFPVDDCAWQQRPVDVGDPSPVLSGKSVIDLRDELMAQLRARQPTAGSWTDGTRTTVTAELGLPTFSCQTMNSIGYALPLRITTADGRVNIDDIARAAVVVDDTGAFTTAWVGTDYSDAFSLAELAKEPISGVNLDGLPSARWIATLYLVDPDGMGARGEVRVEGIADDGTLPGVTAGLTWQLE